MASFNSWNGSKLHGNDYLLTEVLKNRMNFNGFVVGDWNGHGQVPGVQMQAVLNHSMQELICLWFQKTGRTYIETL